MSVTISVRKITCPVLSTRARQNKKIRRHTQVSGSGTSPPSEIGVLVNNIGVPNVQSVRSTSILASLSTPR